MEGSERGVALTVKVLALALWAVTSQSAGSKEQPPATLMGMVVHVPVPAGALPKEIITSPGRRSGSEIFSPTPTHASLLGRRC